MFDPSVSYTGGFHFKLVLDYGEHDLGDPQPSGSGTWDVRDDVFSSFRSGFDIRTYRICKRFLMFHEFSGENGGSPFLVKSTDLTFNENPVGYTLSSVTHKSYEIPVGAADPVSEAMPALDFTYSTAVMDPDIHHFDVDDLDNLPGGVDGRNYRWTDLEGEGINGILIEENRAWYYKPPLGDENYYLDLPAGTKNDPEIHFNPMTLVSPKPSLVNQNGTSATLTDLDGDGSVELVVRGNGLNGYYEKDPDGSWQNFRSFQDHPNIDFNDPNLKMVDLNGDGFADVLISEHECFSWYPSKAKKGYDPIQKALKARDEETGPAVVFSDQTQSVYLADMSGDGMTDICRIRNGEVCYWPNLGYGIFGAKITMGGAPHFDFPDQFENSRIRTADIDGSGTTDIIYLGKDKVSYFINQGGNSLSAEAVIENFPRTDKLSTVNAIDLFGNSTSCLVWSSPNPGDHPFRVKYIDLTSGVKPYLLIETNNNMGAAARYQYAPSTKFYLRDKREGNPWVTKLPFPVQVLERTETFDEVTQARFVTRYAYHHGYYDTFEREFRGFGMVEQWDAEQYDAFGTEGLFQIGSNALDEDSHIPPIYTKSWFHNGYYMDRDKIATQFEGEYFDGDPEGGNWRLPDTILPDDLSADEIREACRAMKGSLLRSEVYAQDGHATKENLPYSVTENAYEIKRLQETKTNKYPVFHVIPSEVISIAYERIIDDPRISHQLTLDTDEYGNAKENIAIVYPRRNPDYPAQEDNMVTYLKASFITDINNGTFYRHSVPQRT